jgi:hypothetical protein
MTIEGEKAAAFSAKTLNIPLPVEDLTARIVEQSRQLYSRQRTDIEKVIHEAATKAGQASQRPSNEPKPPARPKAQDQLKRAEAIEKTRPSADNLVKVVGTGLLKSMNSGGASETPAKKRRRRNRRKTAQPDTAAHNAVHKPSGQSTGHPQPQADQEHVIRLR